MRPNGFWNLDFCFRQDFLSLLAITVAADNSRIGVSTNGKQQRHGGDGDAGTIAGKSSRWTRGKAIGK